MSFSIDDIRAYYSGAASLSGVQNDPTQSLGGYLSSSEIPNFSLNSLFSTASGTDTLSGSTSYKAFFVKNENQDIWQGAKVYIYTTVGGTYESVYFGLEDHVGGEIQSVISEDISPTGIAWYNPGNLVSGIPINDVSPQGYFGVWIKKEVLPSSGTGTQIHSFTIAFSAEVFS